MSGQPLPKAVIVYTLDECIGLRPTGLASSSFRTSLLGWLPLVLAFWERELLFFAWVPAVSFSPSFYPRRLLALPLFVLISCAKTLFVQSRYQIDLFQNCFAGNPNLLPHPKCCQNNFVLNFARKGLHLPLFSCSWGSSFWCLFFLWSSFVWWRSFRAPMIMMATIHRCPTNRILLHHLSFKNPLYFQITYPRCFDLRLARHWYLIHLHPTKIPKVIIFSLSSGLFFAVWFPFSLGLFFLSLFILVEWVFFLPLWL